VGIVAKPVMLDGYKIK